MSGERSELWNRLKDAGAVEKPYQKYTTEELREAVAAAESAKTQAPPPQAPPVASEKPPAQKPKQRPVPVARKDPEEMPGQRLNTHADDEPLRKDPDTGYIWYQEEVLKPATAKPRGRRVLKYIDPGTKVESFRGKDGFVEEFEVAGQQNRVAEAKITLPSYQVGKYKDPSFPMFMIHTYAGRRGFSRESVEKFYGSADLIPDECKRVYVASSLCYDIRSVIRAIEKEARQIQLSRMQGVQHVR